ncbi:MAG: hypothetical protein LBU23_09820 [Planctomycetota bacterium]|nr:hypothetical protein [Planctomycetota bacterium]
MLGKKGWLVAAALFIASVFLTGQARLALDAITEPFRDDFREMSYLPRGDALKIIACGFNAPLADALFIKSLIYYAESFRAKTDKTARRAYVHPLFDVITDLSPRFTRAFQIGSMLLSSTPSLANSLEACRLLDKGVGIVKDEETRGRPIVPDPRWLYHTLLANIYEVNVQTRRRREGDIDGALEARRQAMLEYRRAAASPGVPDYVREAAAGFIRVYEGGGKVEDSMLAVLAVWREFHEQAERRGDKDVQKDMEERIAEAEEYIQDIRLTRAIEADLSSRGKKYLENRGATPGSPEDLRRAGLIPGLPITPLDNEDGPDVWLALPDGSFRSSRLAAMETQQQLDLLQSANIAWNRDHGLEKTPPSLEALAEKRYIDKIPEPPLKLLGQTYSFEQGRFVSRMPEGPEPPPELKAG